MSNNEKRTKRVFISDIHLGDDRSAHENPGYPYPYGWLIEKERRQMLADFLQGIYQSEDVKELIILGDLFDQWVCPVSLEPIPDYKPVVGADINKEIIAALSNVCNHEEITLTYVPGNHDILTLLDNTFTSPPLDKTVIPPGPSPVVRVYQSKDNFIAAEHGSQYTMFCSPDTWDHPGGYLPLGFYLSRMGANKKAKENKKINPIDVALKYLKDVREDIENNRCEGMMKDVFRAVAGDCGLGDNDKILMNGVDNNPDLTVLEVAERYEHLLSQWSKQSGTGLSSLDAVLYELLKLQGAAQRMYFSKNKARIVVFGHTHHALIEGYRGEQPVKGFTHNVACDYIYANTGTWIDNYSKCTYVETEEIPGEHKHYVRLFHYRGKDKRTKMLMDGFIPL
jgi:UDP-2,3-diacylglucosamine pyrophosphatase LpxH